MVKMVDLYQVSSLKESTNTCILLDVLLCSIAEYFYELCRILTSQFFFVRTGEFRGYLFTGMHDRTMRSGTELAREIQLTD